MKNRILRIVTTAAIAGLALLPVPVAAESLREIDQRDAEGVFCTADATTLCLLGGIYSATLSWRQAGGNRQEATAVSLTDDAGYFFFNNPNNIEVVVKMVNACSFNSRRWVFAAGLTNVEAELAVTAHGVAPQVYNNALGSPFQPIQDTDAFSNCP